MYKNIKFIIDHAKKHKGKNYLRIFIIYYQIFTLLYCELLPDKFLGLSIYYSLKADR